MIDHLSLQVADVDAASSFYPRVFAPLGVRAAMRMEDAVGVSGKAFHEAVDEVFALAREAGANVEVAHRTF